LHLAAYPELESYAFPTDDELRHLADAIFLDEED
jgi:hypothetical protein